VFKWQASNPRPSEDPNLAKVWKAADFDAWEQRQAAFENECGYGEAQDAEAAAGDKLSDVITIMCETRASSLSVVWLQRRARRELQTRMID
jgi:hypothetical protein